MAEKTVYDVITDRIVERLEAGCIPWQKPWNGDAAPTNLVSKKPYRGINVFLLGSAGFASPYWVSYKQAQDLGGHVRKGEKGYPCIFWKRDTYKAKKTDEDTGEEITELKQGLLLRYYTVFNVEQCDGLNMDKIPALQERDFDPIEACESVVANMPQKPILRHGEARAYYRPAEDLVNMPRREVFKGEAEYYSTLFHELAHSTGHECRIGRKGVTGTSGDWTVFGSTPYAQEELVAEMGSAFLCGHVGIEPHVIDNQAAYIDSWLGRLRKDKKMLVYAAAQAQKAADFILGRKYSE